MSLDDADRAYANAMMEHLVETAFADAGMRIAILAAANAILVAEAATQDSVPPKAQLAAAVAQFGAQAQASLRELRPNEATVAAFP